MALPKTEVKSATHLAANPSRMARSSFGTGTSAMARSVDRRSVLYSYMAGGAYAVTLTVTDKCGAPDSNRLLITLEEPDPWQNAVGE